MLPVNIDDLIKGSVIESSRIEFKEGWNPEKVLHTVCAFANDFENIGGGYVVIGVRELEGGSKEMLGVPPGQISKIESELFKLCNLIEPRYNPTFSVVNYQGRELIVLWAPADNNRPFKCPVKVTSNKSEGVERGYYIRRMSHTIRANHDEEIQLISISARASFDDSPNTEADVSDLKYPYMNDYLNTIGSSLAGSSSEDMVESMRLVSGPPEARHPLNVGLMMFNDDPERFFPYARIEVVWKPDPTGEGMTENIFRGPVDMQLRNALIFIRGTIIREKIFKFDDRPEALRIFNYPLAAVEEILSNAVYHKSYQIREPITVTVTQDSMEILSLPGPDPSISDKDIADLRMRSTFYRNKRLGDFLKELRLTEGRNTGIPKAIRALRANGSELPRYETDKARSYLRVTIPVHERFRTAGEAVGSARTARGTRRTSEELEEQMKLVLHEEGCLPSKELSRKLGYSKVTNLFRSCLAELIEKGDVVYTHPENLRHPRQRVCLNEKRNRRRPRSRSRRHRLIRSRWPP